MKAVPLVRRRVAAEAKTHAAGGLLCQHQEHQADNSTGLFMFMASTFSWLSLTKAGCLVAHFSCVFSCFYAAGAQPRKGMLSLL